MADFARIKNGEDSYPRRTFDGQENQSYGFNPAYKLQTGTLRGVQSVGYGGVKIDGSNNRIQMEANDIRVTLGDVSNTDNLTGLALFDTITDKNLVTVGRDTTSDNTTIGLTAYDGLGKRRLQAGTFPDGSVKIKLSQDEYDVATATDDQLIWSSDFNMFKIVASGTITIPDPGAGSFTQSVVSVDTGIHASSPLAYSAYVVGSTGTSSSLPFISPALDAVGFYGGILWMHDTFTQITDGRVEFVARTNNYDVVSGPGAVNVKYFIFKETGAA